MLAALSFMIAAPTQGLPAQQRLGVFLSRAPHLEVEAEIVLVQNGGRAELSLRFLKSEGNRQSQRVSRKGDADGPYEEWRQNGGDGILLNSQSRLYNEYSPLPFLVQPPPDAGPSLALSYPSWFVRVNGGLVDSNMVKSEGDNITYSQESERGSENFTLTVDSQGKPLKLVHDVKGMVSYTLEITFTQVSQGMPPAAAFDVSPPVGWSPVAIKERTPVQLGEAADDTTFPTGEGSKENLKALVGSGAILVFTDADCVASEALRKALPGLLPRLKAKGMAVVEVQLGSAKPALPGIRAVRDASGTLEKALGIPSTPYLLALDKDLKARAAYSSFGPGEEGELVKALTTLQPLPEGS